MSYCELPEFYRWRELTARKQHRCCECSAPILPGEKYLYVSGKWDGNLDTFRQHLLCAEACMLIRDKINDECILFGQLHEWFSEAKADDWYAKSERYKNAWRQLRRLMTRIRWRERGAVQQPTEAP